ncbi:hypothetical protein [Cognatishimia sp. F0-27]|uniref:hypothetical protein n=1 Tax=Cognatishimia sp. F0-27 TaxID=2816855 RepID=UPI001D0C419E|nr:hypothetical protein [Cognatishimia sp. F0-27]MCC1493133.1 hypothetical protein [Cognatishimia sp. F0-27]
MCLTAAAFAAFLNIIAFDRIEQQDGRVIVHATTREAHWVARGDEWCTMAPQIDRMIRFASN